MNDMLRNLRRKIDLHPADVLAAFTLLTRLPVPVDHDFAGKRGARAAWSYPLVGAVLGGMAGVVSWLLVVIGVPAAMAAIAAVGCLMFWTGALHEDGLSDCADGFGGGKTVEDRLAIMKDSRIGAFGGAALMVAILARWSGYEVLAAVDWVAGFAAVGAASRLPMVLVMFAMPLARPNGLAARVGLVPASTAGVAVLVTLLVCAAMVGTLSISMILISILSVLPLCWMAWRRIEGSTGDVLGGCQQLAEIAALACLAAVI